MGYTYDPVTLQWKADFSNCTVPWTDTTLPMLQWDDGEPDLGQAFCGELRIASRKIQDRECEQPKSVICQKPDFPEVDGRALKNLN